MAAVATFAMCTLVPQTMVLFKYTNHAHLVAYISILEWPSDSAAGGLCNGDLLQLVLETEVQSPVWAGLVLPGLSSLAISGHSFPHCVFMWSVYEHAP